MNNTSNQQSNINPIGQQDTIQTQWNIIIYNIRGMNQAHKRQIWNKYCETENITVAFVTETQVQNNTTKYWKNENYHTW